jgi:phosphoribosylformylglycinamidine cyclo-ligase
MGAVVDTSSWDLPEVFRLIEDRGVARDEMFRVFNMGIGFCLVVDRDAADRVMTAAARVTPVVIGEVTGEPGVVLK